MAPVVKAQAKQYDTPPEKSSTRAFGLVAKWHY